jgi:hypothetical protein
VTVLHDLSEPSSAAFEEPVTCLGTPFRVQGGSKACLVEPPAMRWRLFFCLCSGLFLAALAVALLSTDAHIAPILEPSPPGKTPIQAALAVAMVVGWVLGSAAETVWRDSTELAKQPLDEFAWAVLLKLLPRLLGGVLLAVVITAAVTGLEALGIGLGSH